MLQRIIQTSMHIQTVYVYACIYIIILINNAFCNKNIYKYLHSKFDYTTLKFILNYWMLGAGALGRPRGMEWGGRREEGSGWGTHVYLWRIHFDIWQI